MKKFGFATVIASGLVAGVLGLAGPAQAASIAQVPASASTVAYLPTGVDHHAWLDQIAPKVNVPQVDTSVRHSGR
jgi:hypothetical protein